MRYGSRNWNELREVKITPHYLKNPDGSVLMQVGSTWVICTAMIENKVPPFLRGENRGWVTAEYSLLPASTGVRSTREATLGRVGGRTYEIQRLIGRSLRSVTDLAALGERTVWIDCDVIQADGGTRTAAITGSFLALSFALDALYKQENLPVYPILDYLAAVSVGIVEGDILLDLEYSEDFRAEVDMNVIMCGKGDLVEVQGTAEGQPFSRENLNTMLDLAAAGIGSLIEKQKNILGGELCRLIEKKDKEVEME